MLTINRYKRPFDKGNMYITFEVVFPSSNWTDLPKLIALEKILPARIPVAKNDTGAEVDECKLSDVDPRQARSRATDYEDEEEEEGQGQGGPGVQCAQQ